MRFLKGLPPWLFVAMGVSLILVPTAVIWAWMASGGSRPVVILPIADQQTCEETWFELEIPVRLGGVESDRIRFELWEGPPGAVLDPSTGEFRWYPLEQQGPGRYQVTVRAALDETAQPVAERTFTVFVAENNQPPEIKVIEDCTASVGEEFAFFVQAVDPDDAPYPLRYQLRSKGPLGAKIDIESGLFRWRPKPAQAGASYEVVVEVAEAASDGLVQRQAFTIVVDGPPPITEGQRPELARHEAQDPAAANPGDVTAAEAEPVTRPPPLSVARVDGKAAAGPRPDAQPGRPAGKQPAPPAGDNQGPGADSAGGQDPLAAVLDLFDKSKRTNPLFSRSAYPLLRKMFADRFAEDSAYEMRRAWGDDYDAMTAWFAEHPGIREEFFTALDARHDKVEVALALFRDLKSQFPEQIVPFANLAVAVALVWDNESRGVYHYGHHQRRTHSKMPAGQLDAVDNFRYLVNAHPLIRNRAQWLPWEFLTLVVNHDTPLDERSWAVTNYLPKQRLFGKCYSDVPYDTEMRDTGSKITRLDGHDYTLPNLRQYGGVCSMQADFAGRVGKSIGVPAASVSGQNRYLGHHAWVVWVELQGVSKSGIAFSLESHGRYRGDKYYVGHLTDPKTGRGITDRQLMLHLHTVGRHGLVRRQAALIMRAYPQIREAQKMDVTEQLVFLNDVIGLCPEYDEPWLEMARMSREGVLGKEQRVRMNRFVKRLVSVFAAFPDFVCHIFDDFVAFEENPEVRSSLFRDLVVSCESAGRPDLACEATLTYTEKYLVQQKQPAAAVETLAYTILKFPGEGRYVPRLLDKLETCCKEVEGSQQHLLEFYARYLPLVPKKRGSRPSDFCIKMYERAIQHCKENQLAAAARMLRSQVDAIKAGK